MSLEPIGNRATEIAVKIIQSERSVVKALEFDEWGAYCHSSDGPRRALRDGDAFEDSSVLSIFP